MTASRPPTPPARAEEKVAGIAPAPGVGLIRSLVGIRGWLSAVVLAVHLAPFALALTPVAEPVWTYIWHHGYWALDFFLVLSGFVVTSGYRRRFAHWPGPGVYGRFLWARLSRFYPVHIAVLAALVAAALLGPLVGLHVPHGGDLGWDLARQVLLTQGWGGADALTWNGPTWSLSAEWFCYLLMPLIIPFVLWFRRPSTVIVGYLVTMAVPLVAYGILGYDDGHITYIAPLWRAVGEFTAGALLCQLQHVGSRLPELAGRYTGPILLASLLLLAGFSIAELTLLGIMPVAGLLVLALAQQRGRIDAGLSGRRALLSGELSVSLFLTHVPWLLAATQIITPQRFPGAWGWGGVLLLIGGAVGVAVVTYLVIERPAQEAMRTMLSRPRATGPETATGSS